MDRRKLLLMSGRPRWLLPGNPSMQLDFANGRAWLNGRVVTGEASIKALFSTFTTPSHYATGSDGVLYLIPANSVDAYYMPAGTCRGVLIEESRTNVVLWNRDLTNAAWTKNNITAAKDQTGVDGIATSASRITATAGNATALQSITLSSSARFQTAYVKRITGSGTINMTMDNGSTWTPITVTAGWTRVSIPTQTISNPIVGFRIVTSGDAIAVDLVDNENGTFATSPIATTTIATLRTSGSIIRTYGSEFGVGAAGGSVYVSFIPKTSGVTPQRQLLLTIDAPGNNRFEWRSADTAGTQPLAAVGNGSTVASLSPASSAVQDQLNKVMVNYDQSSSSLVLNGATPVTAATGYVDAATTPRMAIGSTILGANVSNFYLNQLAYYKGRVADANSVALTT